jgi:hypothetical protein
MPVSERIRLARVISSVRLGLPSTCRNMASTTVSLGSSSFWGSMSMICRGSHGPPERLATPSSADV